MNKALHTFAIELSNNQMENLEIPVASSFMQMFACLKNENLLLCQNEIETSEYHENFTGIMALLQTMKYTRAMRQIRSQHRTEYSMHYIISNFRNATM